MKNLLLTATLILTTFATFAQDKKVTRIAKITVDSTQLPAYGELLKEQMNAAIKLEPGVLSYNVYADKMHPYIITIVEVYADNESYLSHREAPHFKKYKLATKEMVKSLELSEVTPVLAVAKEEKR